MGGSAIRRPGNSSDPSCRPSSEYASAVSYIPLVALTAALALGRAGAVPVAAQHEMRVAVGGLRTEYKENPLGIDVLQPRFSWQLKSSRRGVRQTAYQIRVAGSETDLKSGRRLMWDSNRVESAESTHRAYGGPSLESGRRYHWQVRVWDESGAASPWSDVAWWEMGLMAAGDWKASWIEPDVQEDPNTSPPAPMLRKTFQLRRGIRSARAYVTSRGLYELHINGRRVGDELFTPGWTAYKHRLQYQTYNVTELLQGGANVAGAILGDGWYRGNIGFRMRRNFYGDRLALLLQIDVRYDDGSRDVVVTDASWKSSTGPIRMSEIYLGETYDARLEKTGWAQPGHDDSTWSGVRIAEASGARLVAPAGPPVKRIQEIKPIKILRTPAGETVVDMGQNMVGWVRLRVAGPAGTTVTLRHAEVLDRDGKFYVANLRRAAQKVEYTLKGGGEEVYEPHFTFQGFRYVAVSGYPGELSLDSLTGIVIHSDLKPAGEFTASLEAINQLQRNILWGLKGNFVDVPTDCPQRDERLGWTGDAQVFAPTAAFNTDVAAFFTKWLRDVAADQYENGSVPWVIPDVVSTREQPGAGSAGWADAAVIIPWTMYLTYGDRRLLEEQFPSMVKWVDYMRQRAGDDRIWTGDFHFGDWLAFATARSDYPGATTGKDLIATAFFARSTDLLAQVARVLGKPEDAARYDAQLSEIKAAFVREFVTPGARVGENTQTAYALALHFDLLPEAMRAPAAARLASEIRERKHLTTGFLGTPYLLHVLTRFGYLDEAYLLLERTEYPSWLYPVTKGATTIWERWDGIKPDGTFQDAGMNSFNHYAYGAVGEWMYRVMAGLEIDPESPAYRHVLIQPRPGGSFTSAAAVHQTMYGRLSSAWKRDGNRFELTIEVPPNTQTTVRLPFATLADVTEAGKPLAEASGLSGARQDGHDVVVETASGSYTFAFAIRK